MHRRIFYEELKCKITESVLEVWQNKYFLHPNDPEIWSLARECCSETKLLELQWKILHNIYPTGVLLKKMKIRNDDRCQFCEEVDTLSHFFVSCKISNVVWEEADKIVSVICGKPVTLSERNKIFGILTLDNFENIHRQKTNHIILICKRTISKFKYERVGDIKLVLENQLSFRCQFD